MIKSFRKLESAVDGLNTSDAGGVILTTPGAETQTANANIDAKESILENANTDPGLANANTPKWEGDLRYFQSGKKQGQMKPSASVSGVDAEKSNTVSKEFGKLDVSGLKLSNGAAKKANALDDAKKADIKALKEKKKELSAEFSSKVVMRLLDAMVSMISKGTYGGDFTEKQIKDRLTYRDMLQVEWREYLMTLDVDLAPWAMVAVGSLDYVGAGFNSSGGKERVQSMSEKIGGKIFGWMFRSKK